MPTLPLLAMFVEIMGNGHAWCKLRYADQSEQLPFWLTVTEMIRLAREMQTYEWATLQDAIKNPGNWMEVK